MKRCSISLVIREMQVKATIRYHYTCIKTAKIKNIATPNDGKNVKKLFTHALLVGM